MGTVRVAMLVFAVVSCGPRAEPGVRAPTAAAPAAPAPPGRTHWELVRQETARPRYLVGEVCLSAAYRDAHYFPLFAGGDIGWTADESATRAPLSERPQHFNVLGFDGERHGRMVTAVDGAPADPRGFVGDYDGVKSTGPCSFVLPDGVRGVRTDCASAGGCGIAVAFAARTSPPPAPPVVDRKVTDLCVSEEALIGDLDGDGTLEAYPLDGFRDQAEIPGMVYTGAPCKKQFAWYHVELGADTLAVLGAADLDRDGHLELMIALTPAGGQRTVALYTPVSEPALGLERRAVVAR